uniref:Uncharacterized protein n=1 Tax=Sus scrofa TaxID=9823 RepID=A0A5G2QY98_PIG
ICFSEEVLVQYWRGCGEKGTLVHYWWECKLVQPLWKTIRRVLKKLKIELPYDLAIPLHPFPIYAEKNGNTNLKRYMHPNIHSSTIYNCQDMEQLKFPSTDEWIKKMQYVDCIDGILLSH